ncbi:lipopolysaccharide biosynthesis protein [Antarcticirhabdus aurantiaca]|uniref:Lipopolysaccharide biosynthesis protein n=2 Tax=Antarcticirhabdus aurantiaca TaxID=2606717 RepID=A0ACD4NQ58_9HYPH|nr:lipopolysaccharide biosynthesis protein [Jeongeuplla avenae]
MMRTLPAWTTSLKGQLSLARDFAALVSGSAGRLVISLGYFVCVANALSVAEFGLFATASAVGVVLSRVAGLGFTSPLYRASTVKPRLIGVATGNLLAATLLSLPLVLLGALAFHAAFFAGHLGLAAFAAILAAEIACWRTLEIVVIVNNGLNRFGRAAALVIGGSAVRAAAALLFYLAGPGTIESWALFYLGANALAALLAVSTSYPRQRLRVSRRMMLGRARDSLSVAGAEIVFYLQSELDKLLVLSFGGAGIAGVYAILMRLVDLTALPVRSFNTMLVQKLMREPELLSSWRRRWLVEGGIAGVSILGLAGLGGFLAVFPNALGGNVAGVAPLVLVAILVPAFRNLVEYEGELLYARGRTTLRMLILAFVGLMKAGLLMLLLRAGVAGPDPQAGTGTGWIVGLNGLFLVLWLVSAASTYTALDWGARRPFRRRGGAGSALPDPDAAGATDGLAPLSRAPQPGE